MRSKKLLKLIVGVILVAAMAISIPLVSGCAAPAPTPTPEPTPTPGPEVTPTPEPAAEQPAFKWRGTTILPSPQIDEYIRPLLNHITEASGGRIEFEIYSVGELIPLDQTIPALQTRTIEYVLLLSAPWMAAPIDMVNLSSAPPLCWNSQAELAVLMYRKGLGELFKESYEELENIHYLGMEMGDPIHLISSRPIWKYEDLKGLKINGAKDACRPYTDAGAVSTLLPTEEYYLAGQTGVLDGLIWGGAKECFSNSWNEVYPYFLTQPTCGACLCHHVCNLDAWNELPRDIQSIIEFSMHELEMAILTIYYDDECVLRPNFNLTTMDDEGWAKIEASAATWLDEVATVNPRCAQAVQIIKEYNEEVESAGWFR